MGAPGRNDPCPCGSGKKYKQCCLKRDEALKADKRAETALIPKAFQTAVEQYHAGNPAGAEAIARQILGADPRHADALNLCGVIAMQAGRIDDATDLLGKAIQFNPAHAMYRINLGNALKIGGKFDAALESYQRSIDLKPDMAEAYFDQGLVLQEQGKFEAAAQRHGKAIQLKPDYAEAYSGLGLALKSQGRLEEAVESYRKALSLNPAYAIALNNLGDALMAQRELEGAIDCFRKALLIDPGFMEAHNNLGRAFQTQKKFEDALEHYRRAIASNPRFTEGYLNLGYLFQEQGRLDEAIDTYRKIFAYAPDDAKAFASMLFAMNYHPDLGAEEIFRAYREFDERVCIPLRARCRPHGNDRNPDRRLRIGYVSPDYYRHAVQYFLEPLLARHDKSRVEVYAYAEMYAKEDALTARYKEYVDHWVLTKGMSDEALAERIRADGIDILVDLAGHTLGNRLLVFARKPAPVSVSWLGYAYTTGVSAIDYYLTDEVCAPAGSEALFAERPWRIATPAYIYRPPGGTGEVDPLPASHRGHITFGTLTRAVRVNHKVVRVWSEILKAVPGSRLVINSGDFREPRMQEEMAARFMAHGIARERLEIGFHSPAWDVLRWLDIGLDCFPHNSGTTLFETLYMGVPYVTLAGRPSVGRLGGSILHGVSHPEWIAQSEDEYIAKAVALASDTERLAELHSNLRREMQSGALMDEAGFARKVEGAYREMWKLWCSQQQGRDNP